MKNLTLEHIARAVGGTLTGFVKEPQREITAVTTDSRGRFLSRSWGRERMDMILFRR